ncbi:uncharacterized protein F5Z01DRAFT_672374 [Emericellopsis atlantica]|uniref:Histone chaperone domain-containing protein n=1 Tax=Emericellopsis atlantica TaxID=2614577 RepID=A0A9P7ZRA7_9HYPO|nr:uncharacterized protein F5Z01DRAFT_672374 [Emericellopsis atlantica]KAG9256387.1 hypothetical protein F5Z01DRAFT_672374 [Emericellopsis atlantica]
MADSIQDPNAPQGVAEGKGKGVAQDQPQDVHADDRMDDDDDDDDEDSGEEDNLEEAEPEDRSHLDTSNIISGERPKEETDWVQKNQELGDDADEEEDDDDYQPPDTEMSG